MIKKVVTFFIFCLVLLASSWSLFNPDFFRTHDYVHGARIAEMSRALLDGHLPPRWSQNFGFGYGMPLFEFYAPLPFFIGSLLSLAGFSLISSVKLIFLIPNIVTSLGGYKLGKALYGTVGGWLVMTLLTLAPYRAVNLFVRGAIGEAWGMMVYPWIIYGTLLIFRNQRHGLLITTTSLMILFLSHNLSTLLFLPSYLIFCLGYLIVVRIKKLKTTQSIFSLQITQVEKMSVGTVIASGLLAVGSTLFYTVPALVEKDYTRVKEAVTSGFFDYHFHFLYIRQFFQENWQYGGSIWGPDDDISFFLGFTQLILLFGALCIFTASMLANKAKARKHWAIVWLMVALFSLLLAFNLFMSLTKSQFIWDQLSFLQFVQFPWRWLGVSILWLALVASSTVLITGSKVVRVLLAVLVIMVTSLYSARYFQPESYLDNFDGLYYSDASRISSEMSEILHDYMPKRVSLDSNVPNYLVSCNFDMGNFNQECLGAKVVENRVHEKLVEFESDTNRRVVFAIADFPGWKVEIDGKHSDHSVSDNGLIEIDIPSGKHVVGLHFNSTPVRFFSDAVSLASVVIFLTVLYKQYHSRKTQAYAK